MLGWCICTITRYIIICPWKPHEIKNKYSSFAGCKPWGIGVHGLYTINQINDSVQGRNLYKYFLFGEWDCLCTCRQYSDRWLRVIKQYTPILLLRINVKENRRDNQEWKKSINIDNIGHTRHKTKTNKSKNATQHVLDTTICKQTHTKNTIRHEPSYKQLDVMTNRTSFLCGNCNGNFTLDRRSLIFAHMIYCFTLVLVINIAELYCPLEVSM